MSRMRRVWLNAVVITATTVMFVTSTPAHAAQVEMRYSVSFRGVAESEQASFEETVTRAYSDPRGWSLDGRILFVRMASGGAFTIWLAAANQMQSFGAGCSTQWSCRVGRDVIINETRWVSGSPYWHGELADYRLMLINHETGHFLGLDHSACPGAGQLAPVMMQQSKGPAPCVPNPWPLPAELSLVAERYGVTPTQQP